MFAADWDQDDDQDDDQDFPALPLDALTEPFAPKLTPRKTSSFLLTDQMAASSPSYYLEDNNVETAAHHHPTGELFRMGSLPQKEQYKHQQECTTTNSTASQPEALVVVVVEEEESPQLHGCFWKMLSDFFGVPAPIFTEPPPSAASSSSFCPSTPQNQSASNLQIISTAATDVAAATTTPIATEPALVSTTTPSPRRSAPIKMPSSCLMPTRSFPISSPPTTSSSKTTNSRPGALQQLQQQSPSPQQLQQQPPADIVDEKGHVWRAKFCILQDAVLYFYRNKEDAEGPEAKAERASGYSSLSPSSSPFFPRSGDNSTNTRMMNKNNSNNDTTIIMTQESLARSPISHKHMLSISCGHYNTHIWEKRTPLNMVGAVHNAEAEYGSHCFALLSPPRDDDDDDSSGGGSGDSDDSDSAAPSEDNHSNTSSSTAAAKAKEAARDKLILRAPNAEEMGDWMFQFHCSIRFLVQSLILTQRRGGGGGISTGAGIMSSSPLYPSAVPVPQNPFYNNSNGNNISPLLSPRTVTTLSHGHGRTLARRRRVPDSCSGGKQSSKDDSAATISRPPRNKRLKQRSVDALRWFSGSEFFSPERDTSTASTVTTMSLTPPASAASKHQQQQQQTQQPQQSRGSPAQCAEPSPTSVAVIAGTTAAAVAETSTSSMTSSSHQQSIAFLEQNDNISPELSAPPDPETERPLPAKKGGKYVPPAMRRQMQQQQQQPPTRPSPTTEDETKQQHPPKPAPSKYIPPHLRKRGGGGKPAVKSCPPPTEDEGKDKVQPPDEIIPLKLGGCADPRVVKGSIRDDTFIPKKASKLKPDQRADPYGYCHKPSGSVTWDIGAVSECGIRDSNEDSYVVVGDLLQVFGTNNKGRESLLHKYSQDHTPGLFCIFDGHQGDQAARYAAEHLASFLGTESLNQSVPGSPQEHEEAPVFVERVVREAFKKLDEEFCQFCVEGEREWESGTTALVAALVDNHLIIANLGDARAVACRSVDTFLHASELQKDGWARLSESDSANGQRRCLWKEVSATHSPSRDDERERIEKANGWITYEEQIPCAQLQRLNLQDDDVFDILRRCFADRYDSPSSKAAAPNRVVKISRVCGELAVSRALGDRDFKAAFNVSSSSSKEEGHWDSPLFLSFPDDHTKMFQGDLVLSTPEFTALRVRESGVHEEFFLFACDGLWDVMDADDAVRVTRDLLFEKKWPAREAAARLAELAVHLGSSDNITVIVVVVAAFANSS